MSELVKVIQRLGTDDETMKHLKWLTEQNRADITAYLDESERSSLDTAVIEMYPNELAGRVTLRNVPETALSILLNKYGEENFIYIGENLKVRFSDCGIQPSYLGYSATCRVHVYLSDTLVRSFEQHLAYYHGDEDTDNYYHSQHISEVYGVYTERCLYRACTFKYRDMYGPLEMGLAIEAAEKELLLLDELFKAWGHPLREEVVKEIGYFIKECVRTQYSMFYEQLNRLIELYNKVVSKSVKFLLGKDFACICEDRALGIEIDVYSVDQEGRTVSITKGHHEYNEIHLWISKELEKRRCL